jgi:hypothetical protein
MKSEKKKRAGEPALKSLAKEKTNEPSPLTLSRWAGEGELV